MARPGTISLVVVLLGIGTVHFHGSYLLEESRHTRPQLVSCELAGTKSNRTAIGTRVKVVAGGMTQTDEVHSGGSYLSQNDTHSGAVEMQPILFGARGFRNCAC
jgi:hypothetical protein